VCQGGKNRLRGHPGTRGDQVKKKRGGREKPQKMFWGANIVEKKYCGGTEQGEDQKKKREKKVS